MNLTLYIKAGYPILYIQTPEENRAEALILEAAKGCNRHLSVWSHTQGFNYITKKGSSKINDPVEALIKVQEEPAKQLFVLRDYHPFLKVPKIRRIIRDIAKDFRQNLKTLIIISPVADIPQELKHDITLIEFKLPTKDEILQTFTQLYETNKKIIGEIEEDEIERIVQSAMGLTTDEAEAAFSKAFVEQSLAEDKKPISQLVLSEKAEAVKKSGMLEYFETTETINDIGGLENLKDWLKIRSRAFSKSARQFKLPMPRGILLVGLPGCGKSLSAKATSNILGIPLIRFDVGRIFGSLVGESESNLRKAIQTVEAVGNCVLWIDEMDKAFAGMLGNSTDNGTSHRVFGNFVTWMQEKTSPIFIVATVNRIDGLPIELLRKGRFDEIFFVGLPNAKEREDILKIHIKSFERDPVSFDLTDCVLSSKGFSGAELREAVVGGMYSAFYQEKELTHQDILNSIHSINPLSKSSSSQLEAMAQWAQTNAVNASKEIKTTNISRQLDI